MRERNDQEAVGRGGPRSVAATPRKGWPSGSGRNTLIRVFFARTGRGGPRRHSGGAGRERFEPLWSEIGDRLNFP